MVKSIGFFLLNFLVPGLSFALHGYLRPALLYPTLICISMMLFAYMGYFFWPESTIIFIILYFLLAGISSIHWLLQFHYGQANRYRSGKNILVLSCHIIFWLFLLTGVLFFRQTFLGLEIYTIRGESMVPTLMPNDIVVIEIISSTAQLHENDVVVFNYPESNKILIKRYVPLTPTDIDDQSSLFLLGDNLANSLDSRLLGAIPRDRIIGKAHWVLLNDAGLAFKKVF